MLVSLRTLLNICYSIVCLLFFFSWKAECKCDFFWCLSSGIFSHWLHTAERGGLHRHSFWETIAETLCPCVRSLGGFQESFELFSGKQREHWFALERWVDTLERRRSWCVSYYSESALSLRRFNDKSMFIQNTDLQEWNEVIKKLKSQKHIAKGSFQLQ